MRLGQDPAHLRELASFQRVALVRHLHVMVVVGPPRPEHAKDLRDRDRARNRVLRAQCDGVEAPGAEPAAHCRGDGERDGAALHGAPGDFRASR